MQTPSQHRRGRNPALRAELLGCVRDAGKAARAGPLETDRSIHRVRRAMKRIRATVTLVPNPRPKWLEGVRRGARALHRQLGAARDRFVVAELLAKLAARHPKRWGPRSGSGIRGAAEPDGSGALDWRGIDRRLGLLEARISGRRGAPAVDIAEALRRSYRKARRARAAVMESPGRKRVHAWRQVLARLLMQLALLDPWLSKRAFRLGAVLEKPARQLGRYGDLAMLRRALVGRRYPNARVRGACDAQVVRLDRRRDKLLRKALAATAHAFSMRPREFAEEMLRGWGKPGGKTDRRRRERY